MLKYISCFVASNDEVAATIKASFVVGSWTGKRPLVSTLSTTALVHIVILFLRPFVIFISLVWLN